MNILVISHLYPSPVDESRGVFVHHQVTELIKRGNQVTVVSPRPYVPPLPFLPNKWQNYRDMPSQWSYEGVRVRSPHYIGLPKSRSQPINARLYRQKLQEDIAQMSETQSIDVVHAHVAIPDGYGAISVAEDLDIPLVTTIHGADFYQTKDVWGCRSLIQQVLDRSDSITINSSVLEKQGKRYFDFDSTIIPNGVPLDQIDSTKDRSTDIELPDDKTVLTTLGYLIPRKGHRTVIDALAELNRTDVHYLIIGDGPERESLERYAEQKGVRDRTQFAGYVEDQQDVFALLWESDIFCLPSYDEAFGVAYIEAMACSLPTIARSGEGPEDFIEDGVSGYLLDEKTGKRTLSDILDQLATSSSLCEDIGEQARSTVKKKYTWAENARQTEAVYQRVSGRTE
ncbi:glycosyltransferase [Haladaptatus sp. DYF46]|uniref:glycosyltransferase n=1 Tax=Haladaptatus sp. DYF46 TaxID=2886041 RepID=UPI001E510752|nr:glycosyltransferase [Haladaptatus sp. DYF46]